MAMASLRTLVLGLTTHAICAAAAKKHGILGMGITMYKPFCCNACDGSLSSLYLSCTDFIDGQGSTLTACRTSNDFWLHSFALCLDRHCSSASADASLQECWVYVSMQEFNYTDWVPRAPVAQLEPDAVWLNETMLVNEELFQTTLLSYQEWEYEEKMHSVSAVIILGLPVIFCLLCRLWSILDGYAQRFAVVRKLHLGVVGFLIYPALFGLHHLKALPSGLGYIPSRVLSAAIAIFALVNLVFSLMPFRNTWSHIQGIDRRNNVAYYFSNRVGVLSFANIALAVLFSGRNNPLMLFGGFSQTSALTFHRWVSRIATIEAIIHSILFTLTYFWTGGYDAYAQEAAKGYYWWGILATVTLALCVGAAVLPFRVRYYETFLLTHIGLVIMSLLGCWYHIILRYGKNWGYEVYLYITFAFWAFDRLVRLVRLAVYNQRPFVSPGIVEAIPDSDILKLEIQPSRAWKFRPGQHSFLHFLSINGQAHKSWESHPFSVALWSSCTAGEQASADAAEGSEGGAHQSIGKGGAISQVSAELAQGSRSQVADPTTVHVRPMERGPTVTFFLRTLAPVSGHPQGLTGRLRAEARGHSSFPVTVSTEGPYGHRSSVIHHSQTTLVIGGGVGITALLGHVNLFLGNRCDQTARNRASSPSPNHSSLSSTLRPRMVLAWATKDRALMDYVRRQLPADEVANERGLELVFVCTKPRETREVGNQLTTSVSTIPRLDVRNLVYSEAAACGRSSKLAIVSCGPAGMADEVRMAVAQQARKGYWVELSEEAFAW